MVSSISPIGLNRAISSEIFKVISEKGAEKGLTF